MHAIPTEVIHNQQRMVKKLRLSRLISLQHWDNISTEWVWMKLKCHRRTTRQTYQSHVRWHFGFGKCDQMGHIQWSSNADKILQHIFLVNLYSINIKNYSNTSNTTKPLQNSQTFVTSIRVHIGYYYESCTETLHHHISRSNKKS